MEKLLSAAQVADYLNIHPKTLYKLLRGNKIALSYVRIHGRMIGFRPSELERYIDLHEVVLTGSGRKNDRKEVPPRRRERGYRRPSIVRKGFMSDREAAQFFLTHLRK